MQDRNIVIESPTKCHKLMILFFLGFGYKVWVIEPFHAYHHEEKKNARFYPRPLPDYIWKLVKSGRVGLLKAEQINKRDIYWCSADRAVKTVEGVYREYKKHHINMIEHVCKILKSQKAEEIFKKYLCDQIGRYYSIDIMLQRISQNISGKIIAYPEGNVISYSYCRRLLSLGGQMIYEHDSISFPLSCYLIAFTDNAVKYLKAIMRLGMQTLACSISIIRKKSRVKEKSHYRYAVAIIGDRQLRNNNRRADFIVDDHKIKGDEVVYIPLFTLNAGQASQLLKLNGSVFYPPDIKRNFNHLSCWLKLLWISLTERILRNTDEINEACRSLAEYFRWKKVGEEIEFKHFITHCDFSPAHIARNLALKQAGAETWYFVDSMNSGNFGDETREYGVLHPFWTYLNYDHIVSWDEFISEYYSKHFSSFGEKHVIGCLWAGHIKARERFAGKKFMVAVFDTTYTYNSFTSYTEGIAFARDLFRLISEIPEIALSMKEKKDSDAKYHATLDPIHGPELLSLYDKMYGHNHIRKFTNQTDAAEIMSEADMIVSFPYTSTTFEALSANKPAVWHDPMGFYRNTPYARAGGMTTHSYDELKNKVIEIMSAKGEYENPLPKDSPLMDPYRDGKAIERFRDLLAVHS